MNNSILGMLLPPGACSSHCGKASTKANHFKAGTFAHHHFNFPQKVTVWGVKISSQISIERLLISSPPSKRTLQQKKVIIFGKFSFSRF
jgi:hypothetical protein